MKFALGLDSELYKSSCPAVTFGDTMLYCNVSLDGAFDKLFEEIDLPLLKAYDAGLNTASLFALYKRYILFTTLYKVDHAVQERNVTIAVTWGIFFFCPSQVFD